MNLESIIFTDAIYCIIPQVDCIKCCHIQHIVAYAPNGSVPLQLRS